MGFPPGFFPIYFLSVCAGRQWREGLPLVDKEALHTSDIFQPCVSLFLPCHYQHKGQKAVFSVCLIDTVMKDERFPRGVCSGIERNSCSLSVVTKSLTTIFWREDSETKIIPSPPNYSGLWRPGFGLQREGCMLFLKYFFEYVKSKQ